MAEEPVRVSRDRPVEVNSEASSLRVGDVVAGTYEIVARIGGGGMGDVYEVEHLRLGRRFAIKVRRRPGARMTGRFRREARLMARLENEYVVGAVDSGELPDNTPYLVMELLRGQDLRRLLEERGHLPVPRAVNIVLDACRGMQAVHAEGFVHRDLKPENLFITQRASGEDWCKILDLGVARDETPGSTEDGTLIGTVKYMAPEQLADSAGVGPRSDVYALGAILYECLTGKPPHGAHSVQALMFKIMNERVRALPKGEWAIPRALEDAVVRALALDPAERFANVTELARAIMPFAGVPGSRSISVSDVTDELAPSSTRTRARKRIVPAAVVLIGAVASAVVGFWLGSAARAPRLLAAQEPHAISRAVLPAIAPTRVRLAGVEAPANAALTSSPSVSEPSPVALGRARVVAAGPESSTRSFAHASPPLDMKNPYAP